MASLKTITLLVFIISLTLLFSVVRSADEYTQANAKIHRMRNELINQKKTMGLIGDLKMCRNEQGNLEKALQDAKNKLEELEQNLKRDQLAVTLQNKWIDDLHKSILDAQAKHDKWAKPKIQELLDQIAIIEKIEAYADQIVAKNPKRKPTMDRLKELLNKLKAEFSKLIEDLKISPEVEKLKHKLAEAKKALAEKEAQVGRTQKAIEAMKKTIEDLLKRLNDKANECNGIKDKIDDNIAKLDKMIALFAKILKMLGTVSDGSGANGNDREKVDVGAVKKILEDILKKLRETLAGLKDPTDKCKADEAKLRKDIDARGDAEKKLYEELDGLRKQLADAEKKLADLLAEAGALEGKLKALTAECEKLAASIGRDQALDAQLQALAEIIALIHKLEGEKKLDQAIGDKMESMIKKLRDEIIAAIEKKLKEQTDAYNACKAKRDAAHDAWKAKFTEASNIKTLVGQLKSKIANREKQLDAIRADRKALLDLLDSLVARCANAKAAYDKEKKELEEEIAVVTQVIDLL